MTGAIVRDGGDAWHDVEVRGEASGSCLRGGINAGTWWVGSSTPPPRRSGTQRDADAHLAQIRADLGRNIWVDPLAGRVVLEEYAWRWLAERPSLRPRTRELEGELRLHILPALGGVELCDLSTGRIRSWHAGLLNAGRPGPTTVAKCYRLLRTILGTAVEDGVIAKNPCVINGAGVERHPERPVATVEQVFDLSDAIGARVPGDGACGGLHQPAPRRASGTHQVLP